MAENTESARKLPQIFDNIWDTYVFLQQTSESTISDIVQGKVKHGIEDSEKAIRMINEIGLFSSNEELDEVTTNELRYMLVPSLLAYFTGKLVVEDRTEVLRKEQEYLIDFLKLCKLYGVKEFKIPEIKKRSDHESSGPMPALRGGPPGQAELKAMADMRHEKLERFKEQKKLKDRLLELKDYIKQEHVEDAKKREYWITTIRHHVNNALEELQSIEDELPLLEHMAKMRLAGAGGDNSAVHKKDDKTKKQPMRPFIITKEDVKQKVFGAGYASLPTYTVEEFFDQQVALGNFPDPSSQQQVVQGYIDGPSDEAARAEEEAADKEQKEDRDDPESIEKARNWDDWKDDHRRGWGNTQNKG